MTLNPADLYFSGINDARGQSATTLARLLATDVNGDRTDLVASPLRDLAAVPSLAVRACVAQLLSTAMRHARDEVLKASPVLLDAEDALLAAPPVQQLCLWLDDDAITARMLESEREDVREIGGPSSGVYRTRARAPTAALDGARRPGSPPRRSLGLRGAAAVRW
ncbi:MAG: hypothetical protein QOK16_1758 [Solirubrobacteraceae bacterium]|nr:hypothetical protein [Solirubrobacteraceae bacterium]MEA2186747.1 hypothetical protein [Solirubrobacteraceae bacterium]